MQLPISTHANLGVLSSWTDDKLPVVRSGPKRGSAGTEEVPGKTVLYRPDQWEALLSVLNDEETAVSYVVPGAKLFYVSDGAAMMSFMFGYQELMGLPSIFRMPTPRGGMAEVVAQFVKEVDENLLKSAFAREKDIRISLRSGIPFEFWTADSRASSQAGFPTLDAVELQNRILRIDCKSPRGRYSATFWIDLSLRALVRTVLDGKEVFRAK
jgi:hypothetical protein